MLSSYPELFKENPDISNVVEDSWKTVKYLEKLKKPATLLSYGKWINNLDRIEAPKSHIIAEIIAKSEIKGKISLRPYWYGNTDKRLLEIDESYVCVQSTRTWNEEFLQNIINKLSPLELFKIVNPRTILWTFEEVRYPNRLIILRIKFFWGKLEHARAVDTDNYYLPL